MDSVKVYDKEFKLSIPYSQIVEAIKNIASKLNKDYSGKDYPVFISVLNGSFIFAADLLKELNFQHSISFIKVASYAGSNSTGKIKQLFGIDEDLKNKNIIILDDIIDTGNTIDYICREIEKQKPQSIKVVSLFLKEEIYRGKIKIDYIGLKIPDKFIIGYGMDYNGLGRHYKNIYELTDK